MTEISFVFVDGTKSKLRTMETYSDIMVRLAGLDSFTEFTSFVGEDGSMTFVRFDQLRAFTVKEIAVD